MIRWHEYLASIGGVISFAEASKALNENIHANDLKIISICASNICDLHMHFFYSDDELMISLYKQKELEEAYQLLLSEVTDHIGQTKADLSELLKIDAKYNQAVENFCLERFIANKAFIKDDRIIGIKESTY